MNIKDIFGKAENGSLTYEQFEAITKEQKLKFADLSEGNYVSKSKYDTDLGAKDKDIGTLNERIGELSNTITARDNDLATLQKQLEEAGQDAQKLADVTSQLSAFQQKYDADMKDYEKRISQQAYEFAVKEFANTKKFTSQAAKRDFTQTMIARNLQMENGKLIGGEDFVNIYAEENADAFAVEKEPEPQTAPTNSEPVPQITASTPGASQPQTDTGFNFNFVGVRKH